MRWKQVCKLGSRLPEVQEGVTYGSRALRVRGSFVARLLDDRKSIVVKVGLEERTALCASHPNTYGIPTDPSDSPSFMTVRLAAISDADMERVLAESWRRSAPPSLVARHAPPPAQ